MITTSSRLISKMNVNAIKVNFKQKRRLKQRSKLKVKKSRSKIECTKKKKRLLMH